MVRNVGRVIYNKRLPIPEGSFTVIATAVTEFEDTDPSRIEQGAGFYRGVAK